MSNLSVSPPLRRKPVTVAVEAKPQREGLDIIGGPADGAIHAVGIFSEGQSNRQWPFIHGAKLLGLALDEYKMGGKTVWFAGSASRHVHTHYWIADHAKGELRYKGTVTNRTSASKEILRKHQQRVATESAPSKSAQQKDVGYGTPPKRVRSTG